MLRWLQAKTQTRWSFVLIYGVVMWGGLTALLATIVELLKSAEDFSLLRIVLTWILLPVGGVVFGLVMYAWQRWILRKLRRKAPDQDRGVTS